MDIKQMPVNKGYSHILVLLCEVTNYMVALPLMSTRTPHILDAFQKGYLAYFGRYNGYSSPNLNGYSPYELVFGHKMTLSHELEIKVDTVVSGTFKDYYEKLKKNLQYM